MFAAGLQVCIASPAAFILEYSLGENAMLHELARSKFPIVDGGIAAPEAPGLGVDIDESFVARTAVAP
jgi:L-alanine-DL-glutamate epimerase-like enolase superfamily enzyme